MNDKVIEMKTYVLCFVILMSPVFTIAQSTNIDVKEPIKIGEQVPDLTLGVVIDSLGNTGSSFGGKSRFSEFNGKLIILDFWATFCSSCIENFKTMSKIQEQYNNEVQIFLVNAWESEEFVKNWKRKKDSISGGQSLIPKNLPIIIDKKNIEAKFPVRGEIGYHVWIGKDGRYILRGIHENTYPRKIEQYLSGKPLNFVRDSRFVYSGESPYANTKVNPAVLGLKFASYFGSFNDSTANAYGQSATDKFDSVSMTRRNTYLNLPVSKLYEIAYENALRSDSQIVFGKRLDLKVKDLTFYTLDEDLLRSEVTDESFRKARFCYEQIVPGKTSVSQASLLMRNDLDNYFGQLLNAKGRLTDQTRECYVLKVSDSRRLLRSKKGIETRSVKGKDGKLKSAFYGYTIREAMRSYLQFNKFLRADDIVVDESNVDFNIDIELTPISQVVSLQQLRSELAVIGLDIVESPRIIKILQISDELQ